MDHYELYKDIQVRTKGEIYIGVVGPVRTGKSTFIKRFMDVLVLPHLEDENVKARTVDELPQSASGRTIMTTEPNPAHRLCGLHGGGSVRPRGGRTGEKGEDALV